MIRAVRKFIAWVRFKRAVARYNREWFRWKANYDCGAQLYDHLTGGRLSRAEAHLHRVATKAHALGVRVYREDAQSGG